MIRSLLNKPLNTLREVWMAWRFYKENEVVRAEPHSVEDRSCVVTEGLNRESAQLIERVDNDPPECAPYLGYQCPSRQYLFAVEGAALHGGLPFPVDVQGRILWELLAPRVHFPPNHISLQALRDKKLPLRSFDKPVVVPYTKHRPNYFHWLFDGIGRLQLLEKAGHELSEFNYVLPGPLTSWQKDTLQGIGVPLENCHVFEWFDFRVDRLVVLPCPWNRRRYSVSNISWMRRRFQAAFCDSDSRRTGRKIFIKRRKEEGRSTLNRSKILPLVKEAGFDDFFLDDLSFPQQVRLFSTADVILGAHGAGLANMIFSEKACVLEIFFGERLMFYWLMARSLGFEYQWVDAKVDDEDKKLQRPNGAVRRSDLESVLLGVQE